MVDQVFQSGDIRVSTPQWLYSKVRRLGFNSTPDVSFANMADEAEDLTPEQTDKLIQFQVDRHLMMKLFWN